MKGLFPTNPGCFVCNLHEMTVFYHGMLFCMHIYMNRHERAVSYKSWLFWFANYMEWLFCLPSQSLHVYFQGKQPGFVGNSLFMSIHIYMHAKQHAVVKDCHFM